MATQHAYPQQPVPRGPTDYGWRAPHRQAPSPGRHATFGGGASMQPSTLPIALGLLKQKKQRRGFGGLLSGRRLYSGPGSDQDQPGEEPPAELPSGEEQPQLPSGEEQPGFNDRRQEQAPSTGRAQPFYEQLGML